MKMIAAIKKIFDRTLVLRRYAKNKPSQTRQFKAESILLKVNKILHQTIPQFESFKFDRPLFFKICVL